MFVFVNSGYVHECLANIPLSCQRALKRRNTEWSSYKCNTTTKGNHNRKVELSTLLLPRSDRSDTVFVVSYHVDIVQRETTCDVQRLHNEKQISAHVHIAGSAKNTQRHAQLCSASTRQDKIRWCNPIAAIQLPITKYKAAGSNLFTTKYRVKLIIVAI